MQASWPQRGALCCPCPPPPASVSGWAGTQVQYSLLDRRPENGMAAFCAQHGVAMLPYGVVAGGFLSAAAAKDVDALAAGGSVAAAAARGAVNTYSRAKYASVVSQAGGWEWLQRLLGVLSSVADKHSTSVANVASRWVLQRPGVPAVILGARNALHVPDHRRLFGFQLDEQDEAAIAGVLADGRQSAGDCYTWERGGGW